LRDYSSVYGNNRKGTGHARSMLDSDQAWSAARNTIGEWMQIDLGKESCVSGVITQRRKNSGQRVTSYKLSYSTDGSSFTELSQVFSANDANDESKVTHSFAAVQARYVRFIVQTWEHHISMRAAVIASVAGAGDDTSTTTGALARRVYWDSGRCGPDGDDANWEICNRNSFNCPDSINESSCQTGKARISKKEGTGACCSSVTIGGCSYAYYVEYSCE